MALDRIMQAHFHSMGIPFIRAMFPKELRDGLGSEMADKFVADNGNVRDQRPARKGFFAHILGK